MVSFTSKIIIWVLYGMTQMLDPTVSGSSWCQQHRWPDAKFEKKTDRFWEFDERSGSWVELNLPFDLMSCVNDNCKRVSSIEQTRKDDDKGGSFEYKNDSEAGAGESPDMALPLRKRISLTKMSDASVWVTGQSGSIYERFWNGVQWVIAPHDLQISTGFAVSVFIINQTILALSEGGVLYQLQLSENAQPVWTEFRPTFESSIYSEETEPSSAMQIKSGVVSHDGQLYFTTMNRSLLELSDIQPLRWINHGQPPGGDVAAIADAETIRSDVVFTVSSSGDLYEFDKSSRPSWKKHIWSEPSREENSLIPSKGCTLQGLIGTHSQSLFLLTKGGYLMERRLHQRKWKWIFHGAPKVHQLTAITPVEQTELNEKIFSLFFNTASGFIFEYRLHKQSGAARGKQSPETWVNHMHPLHAKVARGFPGLQLQVGRILFMLDDGRLAELHLSGIGGEASGPAHQINTRRKASSKYEWSILDAPETEGWNAEYCTEERGPLNCIGGIKETLGDDEQNDLGMTTPTRRRKGQTHQTYVSPSAHRSNVAEPSDQNGLVENSINANFRMRAVQAERSFFIITDGGLAFEYLYVENMWLWLRHEHSTRMKGVVGHYNGSLFLIDTNDHLLIRERNSNELSWINCTAMRKGRKVVEGPPWDGIPGKAWRVTAEDALFFVNKNGRLLQFMVALRKFKWKDCQSPPNTKVATVVDQEVFRKNIVFVIGRNGRLYQYNRVTELWHEHYQSPHLVLARLPGTVMRQSLLSLTGSLFMLSEDGGLIEYHWSALDGWNWVEHGTPYKNVNLVGAPGPCFEGSQLFLIGSDGSVYLRYLDERLWQWKSYGFPYEENITGDVDNSQSSNDLNGTCDEKVASVRPIPFSEDSVIFELRDGRLAELRRADDTQWMWSRIIATPTSRCIANYWEALAS
ncbi:uncharacterized protein LOC131226656 isoform X2 [Magnolia sinica]|uniref:uncharacterized protein LOC131226656 isoform X2 n=1 Tax=Magnolia sinica TaxID=86752 RepID=UPI0026580204|nr:uncharacterized protein LOC131226656 isoform X2 [Magnolia sinica]